MLDTLHGAGRGFTIACPAFPDNQRTVFKGHLFVGDQLLSDSGMRGHPLTPTTDANLVRVLQRQSRRRAGLVAHDTVVRGAAAIGERFAALQAEDVQITVVDAVSNADLLHIGAAPTGMRLVTAGSGIAIGLPSNATRADAPHAAGTLRAGCGPSCRAVARSRRTRRSSISRTPAGPRSRSIRWRLPTRAPTRSRRRSTGPARAWPTRRCWSTQRPRRKPCRQRKPVSVETVGGNSSSRRWHASRSA